MRCGVTAPTLLGEGVGRGAGDGSAGVPERGSALFGVREPARRRARVPVGETIPEPPGPSKTPGQ